MVRKLTRIGLIALFTTGTALVSVLPAQAAQTHAKPGIAPDEYVVDYYNNAQHSLLVGVRENGPCGTYSYGTTSAYYVGGIVSCTS
jgi:hypothetical protein